MSKCSATTRAGKRCRCNVVKDGLCGLHGDPERAKQLAALSVRSRGRRVSESDGFVIQTPDTYRDVVDSLKVVFARVGSGQMDRDTGRVLASLAQAIFSGFRTCGEADELARLREIIEAGPAGVPRPQSGGVHAS